MSSLSHRTTRVPRLTRDSDGKPFRRLLVTSKALCFEVCVFAAHGTPLVVMTPKNGGANRKDFAARAQSMDQAFAVSPNESEVWRCD